MTKIKNSANNLWTIRLCARALLVAAPVLLAIAAAPVSAQDSDAEASCKRAWLASDWPTVAISCSDAAGESDADARRIGGDAATMGQMGTPQLQAQGLVLENIRMEIAGAFYARAAVGYAMLKRPNLFAETKQKAVADLTSAADYLAADSPYYKKAAALLALINSPDFVKSAPDSDLLAK